MALESQRDPRAMAVDARAASLALRSLTSAQRSAVLNRVADALRAASDVVLAANARDVAENPGLAPALLQRLKLPLDKYRTVVEGIRQIAAPENEPLDKVLRRTELAEGLVLEQRTSPLGVLLVIVESRPDALPQVAALALRSGNGLLIKGGKEAIHTNRALHKAITAALPPELPAGLVGLVEARETIDQLLALDDVIDLVIPRGSGALVRYIQTHTRIPVMGHAEGICHVYLDKDVDLGMAIPVVLDAKTDYPSACNAMETLLLHQALVANGQAALVLKALQAANVALYGGPRAAAAFNLPPAESLHHEYSALAATVEIVDDTDAAIDHIHRYGSGHTEAILTSNQAEADKFLQRVDAACVFHNASTRFADGYRFGLGAEVGISTGRIHARGPVGVDGLVTTRWLLRGHGDRAHDFGGGGDGARRTFTHRPLPLTTAHHQA